MNLLLTHIAVGGVLAATGAVVGGLVLVALRTFLVRRVRAKQIAKIRQIGIVAVAKQALFEEQEPELPFSDQKHAAQ